MLVPQLGFPILATNELEMTFYPFDTVFCLELTCLRKKKKKLSGSYMLFVDVAFCTSRFESLFSLASEPRTERSSRKRAGVDEKNR